MQGEELCGRWLVNREKERVRSLSSAVVICGAPTLRGPSWHLVTQQAQPEFLHDHLHKRTLLQMFNSGAESWIGSEGAEQEDHFSDTVFFSLTMSISLFFSFQILPEFLISSPSIYIFYCRIFNMFICYFNGLACKFWDLGCLSICFYWLIYLLIVSHVFLSSTYPVMFV